MTLIVLSRLLVEGRPDDHIVAYRQNAPIPFSRFKTDVAKAMTLFKNDRRAALICEDSYYFAVGLLGLLHAGAIILLPPNHQPGTLEIHRSEYDVIVDDASIEKNAGPSGELQPLDDEKHALIFLTSGSTGEPKKILKNLAMLETEVATLDAVWGKRLGEGCVFSTVSHQHIYGMTFKLLWPLMAGRPFRAEMHSLWEHALAELTKGAVIITSPAHLERLEGLTPCLQKPKRLFTAGAPLSIEASQQCDEIFGRRPTEIFGSTETGAFATRIQITGREPWTLLPGIAMRTDDEGHLVLRSPYIGPDWLVTADRVELTADGFHSLGRADRIAKIEGKRISLVEIERDLVRLEEIKIAAVAVLPGKPDKLVAAAVLNEKGQTMLDDIGSFRLNRYLRDRLSLTQSAAGVPRLWRFLDALPTQNLGKLRDADICDLFEEDA